MPWSAIVPQGLGAMQGIGLSAVSQNHRDAAPYKGRMAGTGRDNLGMSGVSHGVCDQFRGSGDSGSGVHRKDNPMKWLHRVAIWLCGFPSHIQVLRLREGDLLLVEPGIVLSQEETTNVRTIFQSRLPPGVQVLVSDPRVKYTVLRKVV